MDKQRFFTSESVTEGHPDKICDQISDAVLDAILEKDPEARVACETAVTTGLWVRLLPTAMWIFLNWQGLRSKRSVIPEPNMGLMVIPALY